MHARTVQNWQMKNSADQETSLNRTPKSISLLNLDEEDLSEPDHSNTCVRYLKEELKH